VTFDVLGDLNWLAVLVAALAYFAIGALWYAPPLFGKAWMAAGGMTTPEAGSRPSPAIYLTPLVGSVLSSVALAILAAAQAPTRCSGGSYSAWWSRSASRSRSRS